jgi:transcriptional antiterminator RfaH
MNHWYAIHCKPHKEEVAAANLENQGYEVYLPRLVTLRRRFGRWTEVVGPLFPRYLFMTPGNAEKSLAPIRSTVGVRDFVRIHGSPAVVPENVITGLRSRADLENGLHRINSDPFHPGARIRFTHGPFTGLEGIFEMECADARVMVLLQLLGKSSRVTVDRDNLAVVC